MAGFFEHDGRLSAMIAKKWFSTGFMNCPGWASVVSNGAI